MRKFAPLAFAVALTLTPISTSAQTIYVTPAVQQQIASIATQLAQMLVQIQQTAALGDSYQQTADFQSKANVWSTQLKQLQQQLLSVLSPLTSSANTSTNTNTNAVSTPSGACPDLSRNLDAGMSGTDVAQLQSFLTADTLVGYSGVPTGVFDEKTVAAVQNFQIEHRLVLSGTPETTGFGRVGPSTRSFIKFACMQAAATASKPQTIVYGASASSSVSSTPSSVTSQPALNNTSTGSLSVQADASSTRTVNFVATANPTASCSQTNFTLDYGDGVLQSLAFGASCGTQTADYSHTYSSTGSYIASLSSGSWKTTIPVSVASTTFDSTVSLSAAPGTSNYTASITVIQTAGARCAPGTYLINFGDGQSQTVSFPPSCGNQTQILTHIYPAVATYTITTGDQLGHTVSTTVQTARIVSAGAGNPYQVLSITAEGTNGSTNVVDTTGTHALSAQGGAVIDTSQVGDGLTSVGGSGSLYFNGSSAYISTPASADFNYGSNAFTVDFWFKALSLPSSNQQVALLVQADQNGQDVSLGGAGIELFGNKVAFVGNIGGTIRHPFYGNTLLSSAISPGTWYHIAVERSGNYVGMYLNGVYQNAISVSGSANSSTASLTLGRYGDYSGDYFRGWIDNVDIENGTARWTSGFDPVTLQVNTASTTSQ